MIGEDEAFITNDRAILTGGILHLIDIELAGDRFIMSADQAVRYILSHPGPVTGQLADAGQAAELRALAARVPEVLAEIEAIVRKRMSTGVALAVRRYRCERNYSWRALAGLMEQHGFRRAWRPASNQIAGMALCKVAAEWLEADWSAPPWN